MNNEQRQGVAKTVTIAVLAMVIFVSGFFYKMTAASGELSPEFIAAHNAFLFENPRELPPFELVDKNGAPFTNDDLAGPWSLVFFGFTFCPDICPTTLGLLRQLHSELPAELQADTRIILASVDPARDTPEVLKQYLDFFNPEFQAVTGEFMPVYRFATALNMPFSKVPGGGKDYLVDHGGNIAILNGNGHYIGFMKTPLDPALMLSFYRALRK